jgi:hypothetical protein
MGEKFNVKGYPRDEVHAEISMRYRRVASRRRTLLGTKIW